jgi:hypothetical protein
MKKIISFSLYQAPLTWEKNMNTNYEKYIFGLHENINIIKKLYPDWFIYLYHDDSLDLSKLERLFRYDKFETKLITNKSLNAMQWRFLPNDDETVDLFISRDSDSRITEREVVSVNEWINSEKILHIMRDHPHHHYKILGGMWGMKRQKDFKMENECISYNINNGYIIENDWYEKWWDMNFLRDIIYPKYNNSSYINSSFHGYESWSKPFTLDWSEKKFIGEIYDENNNRSYHHNLI